MPIFELDPDIISFPPTYLADPSGILAVGGDLSPERLLQAYRKGIFPWFNPEDPILWWAPDPRCVIFPEGLRVSKSMKQLFRRKEFEVTFDQNFLEVIYACKEIYRPGQHGTWISEEIMDAYLELHKQGFIHSVEVWKEGELVGGLYGGSLGSCFFGESMFSKVSNASKYGFLLLAKNLFNKGCQLIDCQVHNDHLESLGAEMIPRQSFSTAIQECVTAPLDTRDWNLIMDTDLAF